MSSTFPRCWPFVRGNHRSLMNSPHKGQSRSFDAFFDLHLNKRLSKPSRRRWFETPSRSLLRHCNKKWFQPPARSQCRVIRENTTLHFMFPQNNLTRKGLTGISMIWWFILVNNAFITTLRDVLCNKTMILNRMNCRYNLTCYCIKKNVLLLLSCKTVRFCGNTLSNTLMVGSYYAWN